MKKKSNKNQKVIIMGGGLAGLAAGFELAKAGKIVIVAEICDQVGGLAKTIEVRGHRFDTGPHRWYTKNDKVNEWMLKLLGKEVIRVPRLTRIYFDHKFFYYPIKLMNALTGIGIFKAFLAVVDYILARIKSRVLKTRLITMEDGYINQFGKTLYEIFFKRYSEKLWGEDCKKISIDWVGQRTRGLNILTIIKDTFFKSKNVVSLVDEFSYPQNGVGRLAEKLAEGIMDKGGIILSGAEVVQINHQRNKITSVIIKKEGKRRVISGDYFISSIPLNDLVKRLKPRIDDKTMILADKLSYRDELQVALFISKNHVTPDTWIYVHPKEIPFLRIMEMDNWSDKLSPTGTTSLVFEIACNVGDKTWNMKDKEVIEMVADSYISEFGLIRTEDIIGGYVHRVAKEYPVYHLGYREDVDKIKSSLSQYGNLQLIGRNGTFRYNNMDHSIEMGLYAAWNIIDKNKKYDIDSVNVEREYLEEKRIENIEDERVEEDKKTNL